VAALFRALQSFMSTDPAKPAKRKLVEGVDYEINAEGLLVFTAHYLRNRGYCCGSGCRHCPYTRDEFEAARAKRRAGRLWLGD